ncbi:NAD(P)-dependent oxidoreductase [Nocardia brasiliensis]|uniref:Oxidoreductase n=1 Tax=Nocardia brasiliensis (strain ATCC 700358 / HUJEG-1) TaxID=1133849 RepID=K0EMQ1_NOCB7|nr:NAD(P)-binding domain-containing protein [Nocardia brasiliensis]AFU00873.1 oxidoreductase [Nocardia brasiliensis ATCC 700358]OCF84109.1 dehydrogenase [Nocardia brasiliensis]
MAKIAFLGTGRMGAGMAARLIAAGHDVAVFNRSPEKVADLVAAGAARAQTPRAAAEQADAVFAMVADDAASRAVWLGAEGALAAAGAPGRFAIECSTLSRPWVLELAKQAATQGFRYIDSPVTGLPTAAAAGELRLLIGAAPADLDAVRPLLEPLCGSIVHFGEVGAGTAYKLVQNLLGSVQIAATAEALRIAELSGLDLPAVVDTLALSVAASPTVTRVSRLMLDGVHDRDIAFTAALRLKDTRIGMELAEAVHAPAALGRAAFDLFGRLVEAGHGELNETKVIDLLRE